MAITILQDRVSSGNDLLNAMSQVEGMKEIKRQAAWERKYKAPYMEALTRYMDAQVDVMADRGLRAAEESLKNRQAMLTKQQAKALRAENRAMKDLRKSDPEAFRAAMMSKLKGASDSQALRQMGVAVDVLNAKLGIANFQRNVAMDKWKQGNDTLNTMFNAGALLRQIMGDKGYEEYVSKMVDNQFAPIVGPAPEKPKGFFERLFPGTPKSKGSSDITITPDTPIVDPNTVPVNEQVQRHLQRTLGVRD
jgi:hypothetical protein